MGNFLLCSLINSYFFKNRKYIGALIICIFYYVFIGGNFGFYPTLFVFYLLAAYLIIQSVISSRSSPQHKKTLLMVSALILLSIGGLFIFRDYILTHRTLEEFRDQWPGTNAALRMTTEEDRQIVEKRRKTKSKNYPLGESLKL